MDKEEKQIVKAEKERIKAYRKRYQDKLDKEKNVLVTFTNIEDPPTADYSPPPVQFTMEGVSYSLDHGKDYELPVSVIHELNQRCRVPVYRHRKDEVTGEIQSSPDGYRARFAFTPANLEAYSAFEKDEDEEPKKRGRKPKED